ncbi:polysaccharide lyase family 8 super-sandwich domain-containing protein [Streptomyces sp. NPDC058045]|uniref:polysaccharide lyase family 8 super-sandwich domain-containing protein n=1 Tax=Streptomyces sp. NPDC058045 TaxID=3346311 RepID=UPI0036EA7653
MELSRRTLLSAAPAAAALAVGAPPPRAAALAVDPKSGTALLRANALALLTGTAAGNARPEVAPRIAELTATARKRRTALDRAGPGELFAGLPLGSSDPNLATTFRHLYELALATRTPGGALDGDPACQQRAADALRELYDRWYGDQSAGYYGNWFTWEIGVSTPLSRLLLLLREPLAARHPGLTADCVRAMDGYLRNGRDGDVDLDSRFHTGANLADITGNRIVQGAVLDQEARVRKAVADQFTVLAPIDPYRLRHGVTDGFYADGSFLQHSSVAYTGSYGKGLLTRMTDTAGLLTGTGYEGGGDGTDLIGTVYDWLARSFAPLIHEGWLLDTVKGRSVSRPATGYPDTAPVVQAAADLSAHAAGAGRDDLAAELRAYVRHLHHTSRTPVDPSAFTSPLSIARYADILAATGEPARDLVPAAHHAAFHAMGRSVHRRPGFTFALACGSRRVSLYEYMSGENLRPWFQGSGAHQLHLAGEDQSAAFGLDHLTALSPYRLPGVTAPVEDRQTIPELYGGDYYDNPAAGFTSSSEAQNTYVYFPCATGEFSGGAALGPYGTAGLVLSDDAAWAAHRAGRLPTDFTAYRAARATRSWFMFDEEIVVLAAGVGDPGGRRAVTTTLDTRLADPATRPALTGRTHQGRPWPGPGAPAWLRYADPDRATAVGYVFLDPHPEHPPTATLETVTRSPRLVRAANPDTPLTRQVFALTVHQPPGARPTALAHALLPGATEDRLTRYAHRPPLTVLANSPRLQAVSHHELGLTAANSFTEGSHHAGPLTLEGPGSALLRTAPDGSTELAVADPTTRRDHLTLTLHGRPLRPAAPTPGIRVHHVPGGTRIEADTHHTYGHSLTVRLTP